MKTSFSFVAAGLLAAAAQADDYTPALTAQARVSMFNTEDFAYTLGGPEADNPNDPAEGSRGFQSRVANVNHIPALEGHGVSMVLFNLEPCGINLPHVHPRATEMLYVIQGEKLRVAFVEENDGDGAVVNDLSQGDVTFFPQGLIHYQQNLGCEPAAYLSALNSEDPGVVTIATRFFELPTEAIQTSFSFVAAGLLAAAAQADDYTPALTAQARVSMFNTEDFAYTLGGPEADNPNDPAEGSRGFQSRVANVNHIPALEGHGVSMVLFNLEPCGINLPHVHPRATEMLYVIQGEKLRVAFVEENDGDGAVVNDLSQGDVTFFPQGLIHYQQNLGCEPAAYLSALNSEDPGVVTIATRFFELPTEAIQATLNFEDSAVQSLIDSLPDAPAEARPGLLAAAAQADDYTPALTAQARVSMFNTEDFAYTLGGPEADNPNDPAEGSRGFQSRVANVNHIPALEGHGVSMVLFNLEPCGINLPHVHPRATEMLYVIQGEKLRVAFVEENDGDGAVVNDLSQGDVTFFPQGLIHYQQNLGCEPAAYLSALNSEDPGVVTVATRFFELPTEAIQATLNFEDSAVQSLIDSLPDAPAEARRECLRMCDMDDDSSDY
eukprot:g1620.t1